MQVVGKNMSDLKCIQCKEVLKSGDKAVVGNYGRDLMCSDCFADLKTQEEEIREINSHYSNWHDENPSGTWMENWQTDNPNYV